MLHVWWIKLSLQQLWATTMFYLLTIPHDTQLGYNGQTAVLKGDVLNYISSMPSARRGESGSTIPDLGTPRPLCPPRGRWLGGPRLYGRHTEGTEISRPQPAAVPTELSQRLTLKTTLSINHTQVIPVCCVKWRWRFEGTHSFHFQGRTVHSPRNMRSEETRSLTRINTLFTNPPQI
jgi:hypothetical protein